MSTSKVEYRSLGKTGLRVSVPIVSPMQKTPPTLIRHVICIARNHGLWFTEMECAYGPLCLAVRSYPHIIVLTQPWILDEEPSLAIMKAAWDLGINTIDTANIYSNGESERIVAKFIQKVLLRSPISVHRSSSSLVSNPPSPNHYCIEMLRSCRR